MKGHKVLFFLETKKEAFPLGNVEEWIMPESSDSSMYNLIISFSGPDMLYNL